MIVAGIESDSLEALRATEILRGVAEATGT